MTKKALIAKILNTLERQSFADWYGDDGNFGRNLMDGEKYSGVTREMLEKDVEKMFGLNEMN
jgi:hypothetical protein